MNRHVHTGEAEDLSPVFERVASSLPLELLRPGAISKLRSAFHMYEASVERVNEERLSLQHQLAELQRGSAGDCSSEVASCSLSEGGDSTMGSEEGSEADSHQSLQHLPSDTLNPGPSPGPLGVSPGSHGAAREAAGEAAGGGSFPPEPVPEVECQGGGSFPQEPVPEGSFSWEPVFPADVECRAQRMDRILSRLEVLFSQEMRERLVLSIFSRSEVFYPKVTAYFTAAAYPYLIETPAVIHRFLALVESSPKMQSRLRLSAPHALMEF